MAKTTFQQFLLHPNHPLQSLSLSLADTGGGSSNSQWVSQMIHPLPRPVRRSLPPPRPVEQPQHHLFQTPSSSVVIVVSLPLSSSSSEALNPLLFHTFCITNKLTNNSSTEPWRENFPPERLHAIIVEGMFVAAGAL